MMSKQLIVAFTGEGSTDEAFLGTIISRGLDDISGRNGRTFDLITFTWSGSSKGNATTNKIRTAYEEGAQIMFIHRDTDQHDRAFVLKNHFQPVLDQLEEEIQSAIHIVPLIIKHEQETWMLADLDILEEVLDGKMNRQNLNLPPNLETRTNTKELFKQIIRDANQGQSRGRGFKEDTVAEELADKIRLSQLARLPSYQQFVTDLEAALHQIGYIR
jgi:hypothetical protein